MSNTTCVAMATLAATLAAVQPAAATGSGGLNANQVRKIVKEEVRKIQRIKGPTGPQGAAGPAGPSGPPGPGPGGVQMRYASIDTNGVLVSGRGIAQENITVEEVPDPGEGDLVPVSTLYCISDLPGTPVSGQVSIDFDPHSFLDLHPVIFVFEGGGCVLIDSLPNRHGFHVLLLY